MDSDPPPFPWCLPLLPTGANGDSPARCQLMLASALRRSLDHRRPERAPSLAVSLLLALRGRRPPALAHASFLAWLLVHTRRARVKSSHELLPGIHGASAKQGPWGQSAERAGCGLKTVLQQQKLRGLSVRAQARRMGISLTFSVVGVSSFLSMTATPGTSLEVNTGP